MTDSLDDPSRTILLALLDKIEILLDEVRSTIDINGENGKKDG